MNRIGALLKMKNSSYRLETIALLGVIILALHTGCGSTKVEILSNSSIGQQLIDLEKAHNQGIISDQEYEKLKKALVQKHD